MKITLTMLIYRWFQGKTYPLWRVEHIDSGHFNSDQPAYYSPEMLIRIVRLRRPLNSAQNGLEEKLPCIQINENQCYVELHDKTKLFAQDPEFFEKMESYIETIEERDHLDNWKRLYEED